jgi:hypothetical protein
MLVSDPPRRVLRLQPGDQVVTDGQLTGSDGLEPLGPEGTDSWRPFGLRPLGLVVLAEQLRQKTRAEILDVVGQHFENERPRPSRAVRRKVD